MADPVIEYFGQLPTTIVLQSSTNFNKTAHTGTPTITPGLYTFAAQADGGLFNFHKEPIDVKNISYKGGGTCDIIKKIGSTEIKIATITAEGEYFENITLSPGEVLAFASAGATNPVVAVTSALTSGFWGS